LSCAFYPDSEAHCQAKGIYFSTSRSADFSHLSCKKTGPVAHTVSLSRNSNFGKP